MRIGWLNCAGKRVRSVGIERVCPRCGGQLMIVFTRVVTANRRTDPHRGSLVRRRYLRCEECLQVVRRTEKIAVEVDNLLYK
jgi:hypothetical protein